MVAVLATFLLPLNTLNAAPYVQVAKLTAGANGIPYAYFGVAVSISGDTMVVGAVWDDDKGTHSGSAYVFERNQVGTADNWGLVKKLTASDGAANDHFGAVVSISGDTIVVGAPFDDAPNTDSGSAYVFERNWGGTADNWGEVKKLTASDGAAGDLFGYAVSISGDTIVVGAFEDDDNDGDSGSAYVFERNWGGTADNWGEVKKLTASDGAEYDYFGWAVSISGDTIVVSAYLDDDNGTADSGSAYVFTRNQGGVADNWGEVKKLTASDGAEYDYFGYAVSISEDTIVVGAYLDDDNSTADSGSAYVFERNWGGTADSWGQVKKLTASDGAEYDYFSLAVSISGDTIVVGAYRDDDNGADSGSAYVFERNWGGTADNWGEVKKLTAADGAAGDYFGYAVSISGDTIVVGAPLDDDNGETSGSAYTYVICSTPDWEQLKKNIADDGDVDDYFGQAVSISGDTMVIGAYGDDDNGTADAGSAYVFERNWNGTADNWGLVKKLTATDGAAGDYFGAAVSISGDTIVVGAYYDDDNGTNSGSAYVFERNKDGPDNWGQVKKLTAADGAAYDYFGTSVSISGDTIVVGSPYDDSIGTDYGSAYVFARNQGGVVDSWGQVKKLIAADGAASDYFGISVSISDDTIVVGAPYDDDKGLNSGSAYVFERNWGGIADNWGQVQKLAASDGMAYDYFGASVSISGDTIVAGAYLGNLIDIDSGSAYVFERNWGGVADNWGQVQKLTAADATSGDYFGYTVCISTDTIVVGAPFGDGPPLNSGSAYVFERNQMGIADNWGEVKKLAASDGAGGDHFAQSVSISGDTIVSGAPYDDDNGVDSGSAYLFHIICGMQQSTLILEPSSDTNQVGTSHTVTATYELAEVPQEGVRIDFLIIDGPNAGDSSSNTTDVNSQASFTYTGDGGVGIDTINATAFDQAGAPLISAQATKEWTGTPNMSFTKTVELVGDVNGNGEANPGDTIRYTANITNVGNAPATNVTFLDTPDINTVLVVGSVTTTNGSVVEGNTMGDVSVEVDIGNILAGNSVIITFEVTINNPLKVNTVTNQGLIEGDNISRTLSDDPSTDTPGDPTILQVQQPPPQPPSVPAASLWGSLTMALLFAGVMVWLVRRRLVSGEAR